MNKITKIMSLLILTAILGISSSQATTLNLSLISNKDTSLLTQGDLVTFTVGLTEETIITGYTLDIRYDPTELDFESSSQLVPFFGGFFVPPFFLDPETVSTREDNSKGLGNSGSGRASVLNTSNSEAIKDLFSLTFTVLDIINDGVDDLTVGFLDIAANDVNPNIGGERFSIDRGVMSVQISNVPVPAAIWLFGSSLAGLVVAVRKRNIV